MNRKLNNPMVGAVEAGGTKFVCAVGTGPDNQVFAQTQFDHEYEKFVS
jgi:hypothetical protein